MWKRSKHACEAKNTAVGSSDVLRRKPPGDWGAAQLRDYAFPSFVPVFSMVALYFSNHKKTWLLN